MSLVTGGAGFIGSNFVQRWLAGASLGQGEPVVNLDALTYAGNLHQPARACKAMPPRVRATATSPTARCWTAAGHAPPRAIVHFAAESHVDRSIHGPGDLHADQRGGHLHACWKRRAPTGAACRRPRRFRFLHVSTDEVYGSLSDTDAPAFTETTPYEPNSPYSASKAGSDHLVRAYHHTYGLPTLTTNCSNNYGPYHFPEKLIPLMIVNALAASRCRCTATAAGPRLAVRARPLQRHPRQVLAGGRLGETYNVGGWNESANIDVVHTICAPARRAAPARRPASPTSA
jgi:dTDP-glucose 4,6-dehydratase